MTGTRVASVPSDHAYVRHLSTPRTADAVVVLPDPPVPHAPVGQWWPPQVLDEGWLRTHAEAFDLVHVHFGFEHHTAGSLQRVVALLAELGKPLVLTVHDLQNPHLHDQAPHLANLGVLVPAAAVVITLTPGAAAEIAARWGRTAQVLPHPHVVDLGRMAQARPARPGFVLGVQDKPRANRDAVAVAAAGAAVQQGLPGAQLRPSPTTRLSDADLWDHVASLDALVLPYLHGTHSGFLEACYDLGTTVIAPRVGYLAEQQQVLSYDVGCASSLADAVRRAHDERPRWRADPSQRAAQREALARAHVDAYAAALAA